MIERSANCPRGWHKPLKHPWKELARKMSLESGLPTIEAVIVGTGLSQRSLYQYMHKGVTPRLAKTRAALEQVFHNYALPAPWEIPQEKV